MIGKDNDTRTGPLYCGFTVKIDNEIVGRSTATTLMHASALNASFPTRKEKLTQRELLFGEKTRDFFLVEKRKRLALFFFFSSKGRTRSH